MAYYEVAVPVKDFLRSRRRLFENVPMVYCILGDKSQTLWAKPLPVCDVLQHRIGVDFDLLAKIEYLQSSLLRFERDDLLRPVHDRTVGLDWPLDDLIVVLQVDYNHVWTCTFLGLLTNADVMIGLEGLEFIRACAAHTTVTSLTQVLKPIDLGCRDVSTLVKGLARYLGLHWSEPTSISVEVNYGQTMSVSSHSISTPNERHLTCKSSLNLIGSDMFGFLVCDNHPTTPRYRMGERKENVVDSLK